MLKIFDEEYGQPELWMSLYPRDPFKLPEELEIMAQILDRIEVLQPFIDRYRKAIESGEPALTGRNTIPLRTFCRMPVSKEVPITAPSINLPTGSAPKRSKP